MSERGWKFDSIRRLSNFWNSFSEIQMFSFRVRLLTKDETWLYHYDPETKQQSMEARHNHSPRPKKFLFHQPAGTFLPRLLGKVTKGILFLHDNAPAHRALSTRKKLAHPGLQCLDKPPYSPDLAPSEYHRFFGLKNNWNFAIFRPTRKSMLPRRPGWTD